MNNWIDIGCNHYIKYVGWYPDRELNPQYAHLPDIDIVGVSVKHLNKDGKECMGFIQFDLPQIREVFPKGPKWIVENWEPLTCSPSLLCYCGDHGFIKEGKWVTA